MPKITVTCCQPMNLRDRRILEQAIGEALLKMERGTVFELQDSTGEVERRLGTCPACDAAMAGRPRDHTQAEWELHHRIPLRKIED